MFLVVKHTDSKIQEIERCRDVEALNAMVEKLKETHNVKMIGTTKSGPGYIYTAKKKLKYIWE